MSPSSSETVQCFNKGCGQKFDPSNNVNDCCEFHPGQPVFHDADKFWSCCNKRSKDFTVFLSMPGCTKGLHNPVKPTEPTKKVVNTDEGTKETARKPVLTSRPRPDFESEMLKIEPTVTDSLKKLLTQEIGEQSNQEEEEVDPATGIMVGEPCKRNGCKQMYEDSSSSLELCKYHPGGPVFHEGLKFWSCCNRKTTDFTEFLSQVGCTIDKHVWMQEKCSSKRSLCRFDWHQTATHVYVTIYAKGSIPALTEVSINPIRLTAYIRHSKDLLFDVDMELTGLVNPAQSSSQLSATKVEIKLRKDEAKTWSQLQVERKAEEDACGAKPAEQQEQDRDSVDDIDLTLVDLSDL